MPFCQPSRLTTQNRKPSSASRPKAASMARLLARRRPSVVGGVGRREVRIGGGVPDGGVDAVDDAGEDACPRPQQPVEPHPALGGADLLGIGRADGGDRVGVVEAGLQVADAAVILDALDGPGLGRQAEAREDRRREDALEGDVVDGDHRLRRPAAGVAEVGGDEAGLPVVAMDDVGDEGLDQRPRRYRRRRGRAPRSAASCPASRRRRGRDRGCPAGRTASARRGR